MSYQSNSQCDDCGYDPGDNLGGASSEEAGGYHQGPNSQASDPSEHYGTQKDSMYNNDGAEKDGGLDMYTTNEEMEARKNADAEREERDKLAMRFTKEEDWMKQREEQEARPSQSLEAALDNAQAQVEQERAMREDDRKKRETSDESEKSEDPEDKTASKAEASEQKIASARSD